MKEFGDVCALGKAQSPHAQPSCRALDKDSEAATRRCDWLSASVSDNSFYSTLFNSHELHAAGDVPMHSLSPYLDIFAVCS